MRRRRSRSTERPRASSAAPAAALAAAVLLAAPGVRADDGWQLREESDGVRVYTRAVPDSSIDAFRGVTQIRARLATVVAAVQDVEAWPEWHYRIREARAIERVSPTELLAYTVSSAPWPVSPRDSALRVTVSQDPDTLAVRIDLRAEPDAVPRKDAYVRVPEADGHWRFTPGEDGSVDVVYELYMEPGGRIPGFLANRAAVRNPRITLQGLASRVEREKYRNAELPFIEEPE